MIDCPCLILVIFRTVSYISVIGEKHQISPGEPYFAHFTMTVLNVLKHFFHFFEAVSKKIMELIGTTERI